MKKEEISKYLKIITLMSVVVLVSLLTYLLTLKKELDSCKENLSVVEDTTNNEEDGSVEEIIYDCSFTRTYNIVNTLDGYVAEVPGLSYVVIDAFQDRYARTHIIPSVLKDSLKNDVTYEFVYTLKGAGIVNDMEDVYDLIQWTTIYEEDKEHYANEPTLKVTLSIKETDKVGMNQKQEPICKTN